MAFCTRDGHSIKHPDHRYCPVHGSPLLLKCPNCDAFWPMVRVGYFGEGGGDFCNRCACPAPWVSRRNLVLWIKDRITEEQLEPATALELRELLDRLSVADPNDEKTVAAWQRVKDAAPRVWEYSKPILQTIIGEGLKRFLGLAG